ncbi:undecaprenyl-phosphate galactose phosphotransferase WbaP [uncultured Desulfovibrio sp.]|uniref:undecaprenyl-phosphate galactose phosphotransferase WbaP n=1 Tax=uncultured Desulfovibrio sp. TaxID=167968 RepID=UPI00263483D7|nr:undecaprenyl-phosphate galactose phosphotransferase WbaP [uncultured Desulfovibrio sp.]
MLLNASLADFLRRVGFPPQQLVLCLGDTLTLLLVSALVLLVRNLFGGVNLEQYSWMVLFIIVLMPIIGFLFGLYQTLPLPPHRELRSLVLAGSMVFAMLLLFLFAGKSSISYSRLALLGSWGLSCAALPCWRFLARRWWARRRWWGAPLIILDRSQRGRAFWHYLKRNPQYGLLPCDIMSLPDDREALTASLERCVRRYPDATALLLLDAAQTVDGGYLSLVSRHFSKTLVVPRFDAGMQHFWLTPCDLGLHTGLLVKQNLRSRWRCHLKRLLDLGICLPLAVLLLVPGLCIALAIRLDSRGPAIYRQRRLGQGGKEIRICKFRTMIVNADAALARYLDERPELRAEWERDHKLKHDPRVTRVGAFLRKTSLDELPQLINVLLGDMSLVGPRPIVEGERKKYGLVYENYCRVRPGVTGLWQVSGRNNTSYEERVALDNYYVTNWSVWMDLWILGKTPFVVVTGYGAY